MSVCLVSLFFFFQAEDGIRDTSVTGVQTCALPISGEPEDRRQLAGGVAHDFNNLLTAILGFAGFIAESLPETDPRLGDVEEIRHAAERAATLTRQLLAFSRKQIFAVRVLRLGDAVGELTPLLRRLIGESIDPATIVGA